VTSVRRSLYQHDEIAVRPEPSVVGDQPQRFADRLCNKHAVKRIAMVISKCAHRHGVSPCHRQIANPAAPIRVGNRSKSTFNLPSPALITISQSNIELTKTASALSISRRAAPGQPRTICRDPQDNTRIEQQLHNLFAFESPKNRVG